MLDSDKTSHPRIIFWRAVRQLWLVVFFRYFHYSRHAKGFKMANHCIFLGQECHLVWMILRSKQNFLSRETSCIHI